MGASLVAWLALTARGADVVLEGRAGVLYVTGDEGEVFHFRQTSALSDEDRTYTAHLVAEDATVDGTVAPIVVTLEGGLPFGVATATGRVWSDTTRPRDVAIEVRTRSATAWLYLLVAAGAAVQLIQRLVRPQADAVREVAAPIADLRRSIDRERWRKDATFQLVLEEVEGALRRAGRWLVYPLRSSRVKAVEDAAKRLAEALADLEQRKRALVTAWDARLAAARTTWRIPELGGAQGAKAAAEEVATLLRADDVDGARAKLGEVDRSLKELVGAVAQWRGDLRQRFAALAGAPLPPAPALVAAMRDARDALADAAFDASDPAGVLAAGDRAAAAVAWAIGLGSDVLGGLIPRVERASGLDLGGIRARMPGADRRTVAAADALVDVASRLRVALTDWAVEQPVTDDVRAKAIEAFAKGTPLTGVGIVRGKVFGGELEATEGVGGVDPQDLAVPAEGTARSDAPPESPPTDTGPPGSLVEWGFDSSTPAGLAIELATALAVLGVLTYVLWHRAWYGTPLQVGAVFAFGLGTNIALSQILQVALARTRPLEAPKPKPPVSTPGAEPEPTPATATDDGETMSDADRLGAEDTSLPDPTPPAEEALEAPARTWRRADIVWPPKDELAPDYAHLRTPIDTTPFLLTPAALQAICAANAFEVPRGTVIFALRGCLPVDAPDGAWTSAVRVQEQVPDHVNFRCLVGVWQRGATDEKVVVFRASTVANADFVKGYLNGDPELRCNMRPTGFYALELGMHREVPGAFRQKGTMGVFRTFRNGSFDRHDPVLELESSDNLHPAGDRAANHCKFSSAGCVVVEGWWDAATSTHCDPAGAKGWATFRERAGVTPLVGSSASSVRPAFGTRYPFLLVTGREARLAASGAVLEKRLRFGSRGEAVRKLQAALGVGVDGDFGWKTQDAFTSWQRTKLQSQADGVVRPGDHGVIF